MAMDPLYTSNAEVWGLRNLGSYSLYYELRGCQHSEKVVALNGMAMTTKVFDQLADKVAKRFQVLTFNYRGVGKSTCPPKTSPVTAETLAFDTLKLLDGLWPGEPVHVLGASMGGFVAQQVALLLLPLKRIKSLQLLVTTGGYVPRILFPTWLWRLILPIFVPSKPKTIVHGMLRSDLSKEAYNKSWTDKDGSARTLGTLWAERWEREFDEWWCTRDLSLMAMHCHVCRKYRLRTTDANVLRGCGLPILVVVAHSDRLQPTKLQERLAETLQCEKEYGPPGHLGMLGDVEGFAARTIAWAEKAEKSWGQQATESSDEVEQKKA